MYTLKEDETQKIEEINQQWKDWWSGSIRNSSTSHDEPFYITTAINYTNGFPHMGHAYEAITADIIARYHRIFGRNTFFLTGSDEHGQKIAERAAAEGVEPIELCNLFSTAFQTINKRTFVSNDRYVRTTDPKHFKTAQLILEKSREAGDIYLSNYSGWYNVKEEAFVSETDAKLSDYKDPSTNEPFVRMEEESYFFRLSKYREALVEHFKANPTFVQPETQRSFILKRLEDEDLIDLSISRTNFKWGIPLPNNESHVMYVWFDALTNYLTGIDWPNGELSSLWPANIQLIGKDIVWFHTVIWPAMLLSAGIPLPKQVFAHGFVNDEEGKKMSKTKGNVIDPHPILDKYPADTFRLFLIHNITFGNDLPFSETNLVSIHNADLADSLGNLVNRATNITNRYFKDGCPDAVAEQIFDVDSLKTRVEEKFQQLDIGGAYMAAISAAKDINNYLTTKEPWKLKEDPGNEKKAIIMKSTLEALYAVAHFLAPFLPVTTHEMFLVLNTAPKAISSLTNDFSNITPGTKIAEKFQFTKFPLPGQEEESSDTKKKVKQQPQKKKKAAAPAENQPLFTKLDLRVGTIVEVWKHPESDHLWCEKIDIGEKEPVQICSGLQKVYTEEEMKGARCIVVNNLKSAKLGGVVSCGMVLCAKSQDESVVEFVTPPEGAVNGERIFIEGATGDAVSSTQVKKKKIWEAVAKGLRTNSELQGTYEGSLLLTSAGPCTVKSAKDCFIS